MLLAGQLTLEAQVAINTDAHAPGQLSFQELGCERAYRTGVTADDVINTMHADELVAWASQPPGGA